MAKKVAFKGLMAYNHVVKLVKKNLDENNVQLKKGKSYGLAVDCSFRDVVKKSWEASKGKSKRQVSSIVKKVVKDCQKAIEGQSSQKPLPEGSENIVDSLHYWELEDYMARQIPEGARVIVDNSAFGGVSDKDGYVEEVEDDLSDIFGELNELGNNRGWDSSSAPTYSLYFDEDEGAFTFRLWDNENRDEGLEERIGNWKDRQAEEFDRLADMDLTSLKGGKPKDKGKPSPDEFMQEQARRERKIEVDKKERDAKIDTLEKKKQSYLNEMKVLAEIGMKTEAKKVYKKIEAINKKIDNI